MMKTRTLLKLTLVAALLATAVFAAEKEVEEELDKIDANKDGKADLAEITAYMKKEFYGPEDIKEEKLTAAQVDEKSAADAKEYLEQLDKNKNSFLEIDEFTAPYKQDADDVDSEH